MLSRSQSMNAGLRLMPSGPRVAAYLRFLGLFSVFFIPVYLGGGWIAAQSGRTMDLYLGSELSIPVVPAMVWVYFSLYPLFLLPLFHLDPDDLARLTRQSVVTLLAAGLVFVLLPGRLGYVPPQVDGLSGAMFGLIRWADTPHNTVPSLHVAFTCLILLACAERAPRTLSIVYHFWIGLMSLSTLLVHQHHVLDVVTGAVLALAVRRFMPLPAAPGACR